MLAEKYKLQVGDPAPEFADLPGVDGATHSLSDYDDPVLAVVFSCNHCPYVQAYEDRMITFANKYAERGVRLVAINSNEDENYPEDSFDEMKKRARLKGFPFDYLHDETQDVARAYGAQCTPHFLVFDADRTLRYQGRFDDNKDRPEAVEHRDLEAAVGAILAGDDPPEAITRAFGCSIKWRHD